MKVLNAPVRVWQVLIAFAAIVVINAVIAQKVADNSVSKAAQIRTCEQSLDPPNGLRFIIAQTIQDPIPGLRKDVAESHKRLKDFAAQSNLDPGALKGLLRDQNEQDRAEINERLGKAAAVLGVHCQTQYK